jgi:hypothetical protein
VTTTAALAVLGASAAGFASHGESASTSYTVSSAAAAQAAEQGTASAQDRAALAKAKNDGAQRAAAVAEKARLAAAAKAAKAEKARKAAAAARAARIKKARQAAAARKAAAARQAAERRATAARAARAQQRASIAARAASDPRSTARVMLGNYGWGSGQFGCLNSLWMKESSWNHRATNGSSGAYGIPQSLPGSKMASAGSDWRTNPATQIKWGLQYIKDVYGSPCSAWSHSQAVNWY